MAICSDVDDAPMDPAGNSLGDHGSLEIKYK